MMTPYSTQTMLDVLAGSSAMQSQNEDLVAHAQDIHAGPHESLTLRLLPGFARRWIAARKYEKTLITLWETSPHLLADMGVVLTDKASLPDHLVAAPARVIDHVAALAPAQVVQAELAHPAAEPARADAGSDRAVLPASAYPLGTVL